MRLRAVLVEQSLAGWGNRPVERCLVARPESVAQAQALLAAESPSTFIPRGLGRAYGDAALNRGGGVLDQTRMRHFLAFDEAAGIVECEAGVSLAEIVEHLLPRGWFLPVTPGTRFVTLGGAIAADVHGKNHHVDGSLGSFVVDFRLLTADGELITCSRQENTDAFRATLGGMGLTGAVVSARLRLVPTESAYVLVDYRRTRDLDATLECFAQTDRQYRYSVAWIDCLAGGKSLGRSVVMLGNDAPAAALPDPLRRRPLALPRHGAVGVPCMLPAWLLNPLSVKAFNALYYARHGDSRRLVDYASFFWPLDGVRHWNRIYGRRGFVQYQALLPRETSRSGLVELLAEVVRCRRASFLAVLKSSGAAGEGLLSYLYPGHTLALDLPYTGDDLRPVLRRLDAILLRHGGRLYLAKDAMTTAPAFAAMYPTLDEFRHIKERLDPECRFASSQARRLGIVAAE